MGTLYGQGWIYVRLLPLTSSAMLQQNRAPLEGAIRTCSSDNSVRDPARKHPSQTLLVSQTRGSAGLGVAAKDLAFVQISCAGSKSSGHRRSLAVFLPIPARSLAVSTTAFWRPDPASQGKSGTWLFRSYVAPPLPSLASRAQKTAIYPRRRCSRRGHLPHHPEPVPLPAFPRAQ